MLKANHDGRTAVLLELPKDIARAQAARDAEEHGLAERLAGCRILHAEKTQIVGDGSGFRVNAAKVIVAGDDSHVSLFSLRGKTRYVRAAASSRRDRELTAAQASQR